MPQYSWNTAKVCIKHQSINLIVMSQIEITYQNVAELVGKHIFASVKQRLMSSKHIKIISILMQYNWAIKLV